MAARIHGWFVAVLLALGCDSGEGQPSGDAGAGGAGASGGAGGAGAGGAGGAGEGWEWERHVALRSRGLATRAPAMAFSGSTLAVAVAAGFGAQRIVVGIEGAQGAGFALTELPSEGYGAVVSAPAITRSGPGFTLAWSSTRQSGVMVHLANLSLTGEVLSQTEVGPTTSGATCELAEHDGTVLVACGGLLRLCSGETCSPITLDRCTLAGRTRVVWDGAAFALVRSCPGSAQSSVTLQMARVALNGDLLLAPVDVASVEQFSALTAALVADGAQLIVAFGPELRELGLDGQTLATTPLVLPGDVSNAGLSNELEHELVIAGDRWLMLSSLCHSGLDIFKQGASSLTSSDPDPAQPILEPWASDCGRRDSLAVSPEGRMVVGRTLLSAAVADYDPETASVGPPTFLDPTVDPAVIGLAAEGTAFRLAVWEPTLADTPLLDPPGEVSELRLDDQELDRVIERPLLAEQRCKYSPCRALFASSGGVALSTDAARAWIRPDSSVAWLESPVPYTIPGPKDADLPQLFVTGGSELELLRFRESGIEVEAYGPSPSILHPCDDGLYTRAEGNSAAPIVELRPGGELREVGDFPVAVADEFCVGNQLWGFAQPLHYQRLRSDGVLLPDVTLPHNPRITSSAGDVVYSVHGVGELADSGLSDEYAVAQVAENGATHLTTVRLPEPGEVLNVAVSDGYLHLLWKSERSLMLSTGALE